MNRYVRALLVTAAFAAIFVACMAATGPNDASASLATAWVAGCDSTRTVSAGDTTTYQHLDCALVVDTSYRHHVDTLVDSAVVATWVNDSVTVASIGGSVGPTGMPFGMTGWPAGNYGKYGITANDKGTDAKYLLGFLRDAAASHIAVIPNMPRARQQLSNGRYSVKNTWAAIDEVVRLVPRDSALKYITNGTWRGYRIADDMGCAACNGGVAVTVYQVDSVYKYAKAKLWPELPVGIRVHPSWFKAYPQASKNIDFYFTMYAANKGTDIKTWFDRETAFNKTLPYPGRMLYGVNWKSPYLPKSTDYITATDLAAWGKVAIQYPGGCFVGGFGYWDQWRDSGRAVVWDALVKLAALVTPPKTCAKP